MSPPAPRLPKPPRKAKSYRLEHGLWAQIELQRRVRDAKRKEGESEVTESDVVRGALRLRFPQRNDADAIAALESDS